MDKNVVILAAGKGAGMNSRDPEHSKVSYPILGKPIINYVVDAVKHLDPKHIVTVVGFGGELTKSWWSKIQMLSGRIACWELVTLSYKLNPF